KMQDNLLKAENKASGNLSADFRTRFPIDTTRNKIIGKSNAIDPPKAFWQAGLPRRQSPGYDPRGNPEERIHDGKQEAMPRLPGIDKITDQPGTACFQRCIQRPADLAKAFVRKQIEKIMCDHNVK